MLNALESIDVGIADIPYWAMSKAVIELNKDNRFDCLEADVYGKKIQGLIDQGALLACLYFDDQPPLERLPSKVVRVRDEFSWDLLIAGFQKHRYTFYLMLVTGEYLEKYKQEIRMATWLQEQGQS